MKWFILMSILAVYWGNGEIEERKAFTMVYHGTDLECKAMADKMSAGATEDFRQYVEKNRSKPTKHAMSPGWYFGGVTHSSEVKYVCIPFESEAEIKALFPKYGYVNWMDKNGTIYPSKP